MERMLSQKEKKEKEENQLFQAPDDMLDTIRNLVENLTNGLNLARVRAFWRKFFISLSGVVVGFLLRCNAFRFFKVKHGIPPDYYTSYFL